MDARKTWPDRREILYRGEYDGGRDEHRGSPRAGTSRIPFEALVEVGGAMGPSFEAQAINVSEDGMQLRTAYLPEAGQPLTCRFDAGAGRERARVGRGRLDAGRRRRAASSRSGSPTSTPRASRRSKRIVRRRRGAAGGAARRAGDRRCACTSRGWRRRCARTMKDCAASAVTVGSGLGFLQVGKQLELEDAPSGAKRPAKHRSRRVVVDPTSHVPQLVVTLRYDDEHVAPLRPPEPRDRSSTKTPGAGVKAAADLGQIEKATTR